MFYIRKKALPIKVRLSPPKTLTDNKQYCPTINIIIDVSTIYSITHYIGIMSMIITFNLDYHKSKLSSECSTLEHLGSYPKDGIYLYLATRQLPSIL